MKSRYIRLVEAQCHNCMRCVRACPVGAMTYVHNEPTIAAEECILCGRCYVACPHEAKSLLTEFQQVQKWLDERQEVVLSVAPSFAAVWPKLSSLEKILTGRGFSHIEETARGAAVVSKAYANLIEKGEMKNIISTACPAINTLIEKEYGDLVGYMAPVVSPFIAHGRMIKDKYPDAKVVFLSPCIAKYKEIEDARFAGAVDACIGMEEIIDWIQADVKDEEKDEWTDFQNSISRIYPTAGGILHTLAPSDHYRYIAVDGVGRVKSLLESMRKDHLEGYFVEVNACRGSCMGGPLLSHFTHNEWVGESRIRKNMSEEKIVPGALPVNVEAVWAKENIYRPQHSEEEIQDEMIAMGKTSPDKIHDCGACGYESCRLKAIAVLDGKADPKICMPEALERAQSLASVVNENTPNGIIVFDSDMKVREMNPAARKLLSYDMVNPTGMPLSAVLPNPELEEIVKKRLSKTQYLRTFYDLYQRLFEHAIVHINNDDLTVIILMDRTEEEYKEKMLTKMRDQTMSVTQKVLDDQMRAVQEIASLLGETTAESKVALVKLQQVMKGEDHDQ
jgi:iron only hydrogenase large subunit-like protein